MAFDRLRHRSKIHALNSLGFKPQAIECSLFILKNDLPH
jgi:hypothetical protein